MKHGVSPETKRYFAASLLLMLLSNRIFYGGARLFTAGRYHWDLSLPLDMRIPVIPWTILIYFGCLLWWLYIYRLAAGRERREADRFFGALLLAKIVCFLVFVLFPTTFDRPALQGDSFCVRLLGWLYAIDPPDNLFPSLHCVLGWLCWIVVRGKRDIPLPIRLCSFLMAAAVCVSTLTTRQHVLADVAGGIVLAEIAWLLCASARLRGLYARLAAWVMGLFSSLRRAPSNP